MDEQSWSPLAGYRILDFSRLLPGPFATGLLADLGADVIKVEDAQGGDPGRRNRHVFAAINRNKRSVAVDLRDPADRDRLLGLVESADAVVESFRPGVIAALGLGIDVLRRRNPQIVLCSISGFGQWGDRSRHPGHDLNFLGLSGFFAVPSREDQPVTRPGVRVGDMVGSMYAALSLAVAIADARSSGIGRHVDVSLAEAAAAWCAPFVRALAEVHSPTDSPLIMGDNDLFETRDGRWLSLATFEDKFWVQFRTAVSQDFPVLRTDEWDVRAARTRDKVAVGSILRDVFRQRDLAWWTAQLDRAALPWAPVHREASDFFADAPMAKRGLIRDAVDAAGEPTQQVRFPALFGEPLGEFRSPAPRLGEHNEELFGRPR